MHGTATNAARTSTTCKPGKVSAAKSHHPDRNAHPLIELMFASTSNSHDMHVCKVNKCLACLWRIHICQKT